MVGCDFAGDHAVMGFAMGADRVTPSGMADFGKAYQVNVCGKAVKQCRTREEAVAWRKEIIEDIELFAQIREWEPGELMPWVHFDEPAG